MSNLLNQKYSNNVVIKFNIRKMFISGYTFLLIPLLLAIPITNSTETIKIQKSRLYLPPNIVDEINIDKDLNRKTFIAIYNPQSGISLRNNNQETSVVQVEPTLTEVQPEEPEPTKTPKPTSTPIPTPPPSDPGTNNLMAIFGILIVVVIIMGIWINWRRVFR